jgi:hypothetical protein
LSCDNFTTSRGRPGFDSLLRSISEMTVLQVQSLPVLANQHRQTSFSSFFFTQVIFLLG